MSVTSEKTVRPSKEKITDVFGFRNSVLTVVRERQPLVLDGRARIRINTEV